MGLFMSAFTLAGQAWFLKISGIRTYSPGAGEATLTSCILMVFVCMSGIYTLIGAILVIGHRM